jgi:dipeptidyl-peptidase-4
VVYAADPRTGETRELLRENDDAWINLDRDLPKWLADGSGFLWSSERSGWWQLELRGRDGKLVRALTPPELGYQSLAGVDDEAAWVIAAPDGRQSHVWRVPLAGGEPARLTTEDGVHAAWVAERGGAHVVKSSLADGGERFEVRRKDGAAVAPLPSVAEPPPYLPAVEWQRVVVDGREHDVSIVRPRAFQAGRRYPVLVEVYAGPTAKMVSFDRRGYLSDQLFADAGFIVVSIDGRGTPHRGREWERAVHHDLITIAVNDQAEVLRALGARVPELDLSRVGISGWSFGGYVSAMAVLLRPDVFHAAVSGAPVTDWRLYDTFYTERYMGLLDDNAAGYESTSALTHAAKLSRPLLLIHGTTDDNVHFANAMQLADALFRAGRHFELLPLNGFTHMVPDPAVKKALVAREVDFLRRSLAR